MWLQLGSISKALIRGCGLNVLFEDVAFSQGQYSEDATSLKEHTKGNNLIVLSQFGNISRALI